MPPPPPFWLEDLEHLLATDDEVVLKVAHNIERIYRSSALRPSERVVVERTAIIQAVHDTFPMQFAEGFDRWVETTERFEKGLATFGHSFGDLMELWRRLTSFLPFIFMTSVNRLDQAQVREHGGRYLTAALTHYRNFYYEQPDRQAESERRELLAALLRLFRRLDAKGVLGQGFILRPLVSEAGGFGRVMPPRLEEHLLLLQQIRNRVQHDALDQRDLHLLLPLSRLATAAFLDVIDLLRPVCAHYHLVFFTSIVSESVGFAADAVAFSRHSPPGLRFTLPAHGADADRIAPGQLYLMRRDAGMDAALSPANYLNLTPFLIYERQRRTVQPPQSEAARDLFVFREFRERDLSAVFNEFGGRSAITVSRSPADALGDLLDAIRAFGDDLARLGGAPAETGEPGPHGKLFERTWSLSRGPLASVMDAQRYDAMGKVTARSPGERATFLEELFVAPPERATLARFLESDTRGLVLVGQSGAGKSNLLCRAFLDARQAGRPAVFLSARLFASAAFSAVIAGEVAGQVEVGWTLAQLDQAAGPGDARLLLVIDAVNEFSGEGGPLALLGQIVRFVEDPAVLRHVQVLLACRDETWNQYLEATGVARPLDPANFLSGDVIRLGGLESEEARATLYASYQRHYRLSPATYAELPPGARALIRLPIMMAVIADTYGSPGAADPTVSSRIPKDIDYHVVFRALTERKARDAERLLSPSDPRRGEFAAQLQDCLFTFAAMVYERVSAGESGDALPWDFLAKQSAFQPFAWEPAPGAIAPFRAALQIGLLERSFVTENDAFNNPRTGRVYRFFHDEYAHYWLAAVLNARVLGPAATSLSGTPLAGLARKVGDVVERSARAPVLDGALDHWLQVNLTLPPSEPAHLLLPLLDRLAAAESGSSRYFVRSFLAHLLRREIVQPDRLFGLVLRAGSRDLAVGSAELFLEAWQDLEPAALRAGLDVGGSPYEGEVLARLGDVFARHFADEPDLTLTYLDGALDSFDSLRDVVRGLVGAAGARRQLQFLIEFLQRALLADWGNPIREGALRQFGLVKYGWVIEAVVESRDGVESRSAKGRVTRAAIHPLLEAAGRRAWQQFIGGMPLSGNDRFLEEDQGVVQRDLIVQMVPYMVAYHNGEHDSLSLEPGQPLRTLVLRMLNHRVTSMVGFLAATAVPIVLRRRWEVAEDLLQELARRPTDSGRFFGNLLVAHMVYLYPEDGERGLALLHERVIPWFAADGFDLEWPTLFAFCIASVDPDRLWPALQPVVEDILTRLGAGRDPAGATAIARHLLKASFLNDGRLGSKMLGLLLTDGRLEDPQWHEAVLVMGAGLLARSPGLLRRCLDEHQIDPAVEREMRHHLDESIFISRDTHSGQVNGDQAIVRTIASNRRFRYLLIRDVVGGLARARRVDDFGVAVRRCITNGAAVVFGDEPEDRYRALSVAEVLGGE